MMVFMNGPHRGINPPQALVHIPMKKGISDMHIAVSSPNMLGIRLIIYLHRFQLAEYWHNVIINPCSAPERAMKNVHCNTARRLDIS